MNQQLNNTMKSICRDPAASSQLGSSQVLMNGFFDAMQKIDCEQKDRDEAQSAIALIAKILDDYDDAISLVNQNGDLSAQGRTSAMMSKAAEYRKVLESTATGTLSGLTTTIAEHQSALKAASASPTPTAVSEMRAQEIRLYFSAIDPLMRPAAYDKFNSQGNFEAAVAIENAPVPLIDGDTAAAGVASRAARALPDRAIALAAATDLKDELTSALRFARQHLNIGPTGDPLVLAAKGNLADIGGNSSDDGDDDA